MNILMVTPFFIPPKGGLGYYVKGLCKHLVQKGHRITLVTPTHENIHDDYDGLEVFGIKSFYLPEWPYHSLKSFSVPYFPWSFTSVIKKLIKVKGIHILHVHGQKYFCTWMAVDLAFRAKLPVVLTIHGTYGLRYYSHVATSVEEIINRTILKKTLQKSSAVICSTEMELNYARRYCKDAKYLKISHGVEVSKFRDALKHKKKFREQHGIPLHGKVVLFVGRLTYVKGILELMKAIRHIQAMFPEAFFVIVGDGVLREKVEKMVRLQKETVRFLTWVPHSQIHKLFVMSDIFVLPSRSEGQPQTILEAMASQLYIVSTPVGGIPETLGEYGFKTFINRCSPVEISESISKALDAMSERKRIDPESLFHIERFDWSYVVSEIEKVYNHELCKV